MGFSFRVLTRALVGGVVGLTGWAVCMTPSAAVAATAAQPLRIMPLGDSITQDGHGYVGYRYPLFYMLRDAGLDFDYVGTQTTTHNDPPDATLYPEYDTTFDHDHEGHWGWTADGLRNNIVLWTSDPNLAPDIVLLHAGTNNLRLTSDTTEQIITNLRSVNPHVRVYVAQLIPYNDTHAQDERQAALNAAIPAFAASMSTADSPVFSVDMATGYDPDTMSWDHLHPNNLGSDLMAQQWYDALAATGVVPEPTGVMLLLIGAMGLLLRRRRIAA